MDKVLESTTVVGIAVSAADPSGLWGTLKEAFASSSALVGSTENADSCELIKAAIADFATPAGRSDIHGALTRRFAGAEPADCVQRLLINLREVSSILDANIGTSTRP